MESQSELLSMLQEKRARIQAFVDANPDLLQVIDSALTIGGALAVHATATAGKSKARAWCGVLWQCASKYQAQSVELILAGELDAGMALLRMASEVARDVAVIGRDGKHLTLWLEREKKPKPYRDVFRFDKTKPGKMAFDLYKMASKFGVHGHTSAMARSRPVGRSGRDDMVELRIAEDAPFAALDIWFGSYFPIHALCAKAMGVDEPDRNELYEIFLGFIGELAEVIDDIRGQSKNSFAPA